MWNILESNVEICSEQELGKCSEFLKKNRNLRIEIKSLLCEQKESQKKIAELKRSVNVFGVSSLMNTSLDAATTRTPQNVTSNTKRQLIQFRDHLLAANDHLLFQLKRKLL